MQRSEEGMRNNGRAERMRLRDDSHTRERGGGITGSGDRGAKDESILRCPPPVLPIEKRINLVMTHDPCVAIEHKTYLFNPLSIHS